MGESRQLEKGSQLSPLFAFEREPPSKMFILYSILSHIPGLYLLAIWPYFEMLTSHKIQDHLPTFFSKDQSYLSDPSLRMGLACLSFASFLPLNDLFAGE